MGSDKEIKVWDFVTGKCAATLIGDSRNVHDLHFVGTSLGMTSCCCIYIRQQVVVWIRYELGDSAQPFDRG